MWARTVTDSQTSVTLNNNDNLTVEASGAIVSTGSAVSPATVENISVTNRGRIEGRIAIDVRSILRLENSKTIKGVTSSAISVASITELFNLKDGTISSDRSNGIVAPTIGRLENAGTIKGRFAGVGINSTRAGTLINKKGGVIESASGGLSIGSVARLENHGAISAIKAPGIISDTAINLGFAGPVGTLINSGTILGPGIGIRLDTGSSITLLENSGKIEGTDADGIGISALGRIITLINKGNGEILGGAEAITAASIGRLENSGKIKGGAEGNGINVAEGAIDNLENSGEISGGAGEAGVDVNIITTKLFNKKGGTISGGFAGLIVRNRIGELENNGIISGRDSDGSGIFMSTPDLLPGSNTRIDTLTNRGAITGGDNGIQITSIGILTNSGRIAGGNSTARDANNSGLYVFNGITTLTNSNTGDISGGQRGVSAASIGRLDNSGKIRGANEVGINTTGNITTLINRSAGDISGGQRGVSAASIASLNNSGRIRGAANAGVRLTGTDATVTVTNSGTIQGGTYGLNYGNNAITRLQNTTKTSAIRGGRNEALRTASLATLNNEGTIASTSAAAITLTGTASGRVTVTNSGTIQGGTYGLNYGNNAIAELQNTTKASAIRGGRNEALNAASLTTLNNEGTITSSSAAAITLTGETSQAATVTNSGAIQGQTHGLDYGAHFITRLSNNGGIIRGTNGAGVTFTGTTRNPVTITNSGTIQGGTYGLDYRANAITSLQNTTKTSAIRGGRNEALSAASLTTLSNEGTIASTSAAAITLTGRTTNPATITNSGTIQGATYGLNYGNNAIASLQNNNGTIQGGTRAALTTGTLANLTNSGTIASTSAAAITLTGNTTQAATITNTGTIRGGTYGLNYGNNPIASLTNTSPRTLRGGSREALSAGSLLRLENSGTILSDRASAIRLTRTAAQAATITNSGTIQGNIHGLDYNNNAIASLTNSGTIRATTGIGVKAAGLTTLNNTGTIEGQTGIQITRAPGARNALYRVVEGRIIRANTGQTGTTINNAGTLRSLKGASGTALELIGQGRDTLKLQAGSTLEGQVRWDGQDDTLHLATGPADPHRQQCRTRTGPHPLYHQHQWPALPAEHHNSYSTRSGPDHRDRA